MVEFGGGEIDDMVIMLFRLVCWGVEIGWGVVNWVVGVVVIVGVVDWKLLKLLLLLLVSVVFEVVGVLVRGGVEVVVGLLNENRLILGVFFFVGLVVFLILVFLDVFCFIFGVFEDEVLLVGCLFLLNLLYFLNCFLCVCV